MKGEFPTLNDQFEDHSSGFSKPNGKFTLGYKRTMTLPPLVQMRV
jgi:hypothetical protein